MDQPDIKLPQNVPRTTVESGTLNHPITQTELMTPHEIDLDELNPLKFDVSNGSKR